MHVSKFDSTPYKCKIAADPRNFGLFKRSALLAKYLNAFSSAREGRKSSRHSFLCTQSASAGLEPGSTLSYVQAERLL